MGMKIGGLDDRSWWQDRCELVMIGVDAMKAVIEALLWQKQERYCGESGGETVVEMVGD